MAIVFALVLTGLRAEPVSANIPRQVCVLVPHFKDEYWLSVGYGLEQEARHHDIDLLFYEAGGYRALATQIAQLNDCAARGVDAILIGAVTSDHAELLSAIRDVSSRVPVLGLVNELRSPDLSGRIWVDWRQMGLVLGSYLADLHPADTVPQRAVLVSGPEEAGWTGPLEQGLRKGLATSSIEIIAVFSADTGLRQQLALVEEAFATIPKIDLLIGSAPAVEAAIGLISNTGQNSDVRLASTYISHTIKRSLTNGRVLAVPFDDPRQQGMLAIRQLLSVAGKRQHAAMGGPEIVLVSGQDDVIDKVVLSPADYFPVIQ
ncbi:TMAO reductase system periplasmic protein TorT [Aliiroseovarius zhejiangensis]|uniref:TMAO reductase system periplasmic protein TorT n=1 Tax=Aliiroseovarius zhejiangensis TaxID=1632025 RepID=A0ABQ3IPX3_9RHOB|nr:TMAO reductase system periplasmic protein TorT [Aliiroseovarius zhejiangensis]GHE90876.1 TMAO reductase system periplasmic protein TorT [Aliiroseovarius zhejiangensis]